VAATVLIGALTILFLRTDTGRDFAERSSQELASGVLHSEEDANWQFRLYAWKEAWRRLRNILWPGEGYGIPFVFEMLPIDNDPRPHNTFLTVLYKMGLIGFLPLLLLLVHFFWSTAGAAYRNLENPRVAWLWIVILAMAAFCFTARPIAAGKPVSRFTILGTAGSWAQDGANGGPGTNTAKAFTWQLTQKQFVVTLLGPLKKRMGLLLHPVMAVCKHSRTRRAVGRGV